MGEKNSPLWKVTTAVCVVLLVGAAVAVVVLALNRGDDIGDQALQDQVKELEDQVTELEDEINELEGELAESKAGKDQDDSQGSGDSQGTGELSDREQLEALGQSVCGDKFHVGEIVIDGDWARVSVAPDEPYSYQGENFYCQKVSGEWTIVDCGTGLQYGDIPGAPASIFP